MQARVVQAVDDAVAVSLLSISFGALPQHLLGGLCRLCRHFCEGDETLPFLLPARDLSRAGCYVCRVRG